MELGVRDWMIIIGVLLIVAVLLDGYRRVRNERRGKIRMSLNKQFLNSADRNEVDASSELPNGGARVVSRRGDKASRRTEPELGDIDTLDLDQSVPLLMESVANANLAGELAEDRVERDLFDDHDGVEDNKPVDNHSQVQQNSPQHSAPQDCDEESGATTREVPAEASAPRYTGEQEIIVINVVARDEPFSGPDLLHILLACDLRHGKMDIFHRHEQANGRGQVQFSVANSVEPGTFDLNVIDDFTTPGVCFFMSVPGPEEPIKAFECMVETAQCLVKNLDGEMLDESRSAMTVQTLEHCRQRLQEFERRQLAQA